MLIGVHDRRPTQHKGYCFTLTKIGPLISWKSRKQPTVALSMCEAEYMALASTIQEGLYLTQLLRDMGHDESKPLQGLKITKAQLPLPETQLIHKGPSTLTLNTILFVLKLC